MKNKAKLLSLLQLASPALPVGAYSYSEGLEILVEEKIINNYVTLEHWLKQELQYGAIRLEAAIILRVYQAFNHQDYQKLIYWNNWLSATRETYELRQQSWQMGQSLSKLLVELQPEMQSIIKQIDYPYNYAVIYGITASIWQIEAKDSVMAYLHSWVTNLINAGIKLIPLGQTSGQKLLLSLQNLIIEITEKIVSIADEDLATCSWGLALASMNHEIQYTRLFRS